MWSNSDNIEQVYLLVLDNKKSAKNDLKIPIAEIWSSPLREAVIYVLAEFVR